MIYTKNCSVCNTEFQTNNHKRKTCSKQCSLEQMARTMLERHGARNPLQCRKIFNKQQATCEVRYGVKSVLKLEEFEVKRRQTNLNKYGAESAMSNKEIQAKQYSTNKERYGTKSVSQRHIKNFENFNRDYILEHFTTNGRVSLTDRLKIRKYYNLSRNILNKLHSWDIPVELSFNASLAEKEILNYLKERYPRFTFIENDRTTIKRPNTRYYLEIDILIKQGDDIICGVEYNGSYYHDKEDEFKETLKTQLCKEAGFQLFHIWEDSVEDDLFGIIEILDEI